MKVLIGAGTCGVSAGAEQVIEAFYDLKKLHKLNSLLIEPTGCMGLCSMEVLVEIQGGATPSRLYTHVTPEKAKEIVQSDLINSQPIPQWITDPSNILGRQKRIALHNCGKINPCSIDDYIESGGYTALAELLTKQTPPEEIIRQVELSGLRGRGGGGYPTGLKWRSVFETQAPYKFIICNADEGDPGAFMDRSILEGDPHSIVEGMAIAALATGAKHGYIYVRAEYPLAIERVRKAIIQAQERGFLGCSILDTEFCFQITVKEGAGAFVCGEETALIASIEGYRGMPRIRPPYPAQSGLHNCPTCINNVETLANIPRIITQSAETFRKLGTEKSRGTKVFALAGKIKKPGLVEVEMGTSLNEIVNELGGGVPEGSKIKAVQMGGPSGGCIPESLFNTPVDYENITATGAIMGSGGMIVIDESTCMVELARFFLSFTQEESCGKCTFCRVGTKRMLEILERLTQGKGTLGDINRLRQLALQVKTSSLCGLGQSAPNPVLTTLKYFEDEYIAHAQAKKCPAKYCTALTKFTIDDKKCKKCSLCFKACPVKAISKEESDIYKINSDLCIKCGKCQSACRFNAVIQL